MRRTLTAAALAIAGVMAAAPASAPAAETVYAVANGNLIRFSSDAPGTILSSVPIKMPTGVADTLIGLDFRPSTGELYATGTNPLGTGLVSHVFRINPDTGDATNLSGLTTTTAFSGTAFGMDFNPVVDRIRSVSNTGQNLRLNPDDGTVVATDTPLAYAAGDPNVGASPVNIVGAAYTNNTPGATTTTLYDIDFTRNTLVRQGGVDGNPSPNGGELTTIGPLGLNVDANTGFDIAASDGRAWMTSIVNAAPVLATVNLTTGAVTNSQTIGVPAAGFTGLMALGVGGQQSLSTNLTFVKESDGVATLTVKRTGGVGSASVDYATANGGAMAPLDYTAKSGTVTFGPGETTKTITIPLVNDTVFEQPEAFSVTLSNPKLGSLGDTTTEYVVIVDDDTAPAPPPPPPPPDKTPPTITVGKVSPLILKAFTVPFTCSEACKASFELRPNAAARKRYKLSTVLARRTVTLRAQGNGSVRLALTPLTRRKLKRVTRLGATLRVTATDAAGNKAMKSVMLTLRR